VLGLLLSSALFYCLSGAIGYSLVFSWWLTAYFTRMMHISWGQLLIQLVLIVLMLLGIFSMGKYGLIYHDAPTELSTTFGVLMLIHAFIAISPGVFGKITNTIESRISGKVAG
jgi:hypothetical protein